VAHKRRIYSLIALVILLLPFWLTGAAHADGDPLNLVTAAAQTNGHAEHGWLLINGRANEARLSFTTSDSCAGCQWRVNAVCLEDSGRAGPSGRHCEGQFVGCKGVQQRFIVLFAPTSVAPLRPVDTYCLADSAGGVIDSSIVMSTARKYADQVQVTPPTLRSWPPGGATLVNLPTYFSAQAPQSAAKDFGGQGYTMRLQIGAAQYAWSFGDGASLETTDPGSAPPDGSVRHAYLAAGQQAVTASVAYGATFTVVTPFGSIGPTPVAGGPVRTVPARMDLRVQEAYASLTG